MLFTEYLLGISIVSILYAYVFYPCILFVLQEFFVSTKKEIEEFRPTVSLIIAAHNEEKVIREKIDNSFELDYPFQRLEIIIASDGSDDQTNNIAKEYVGGRIILHEYPQRMGKVNILNASILKAQNDIIVLSDANTMYEPDAITKLVRHFQDEKVGCVCGALKFKTAEGSSTGEMEGFYWEYETFLKKAESDLGALLGANGGIYAIRRKLFNPCHPNIIVEDFVIPMRILQKGYKVIYEEEAQATEEAAQHIIHEKKRRVRIGAGDFQALTMLWQMLNPIRGFPALAFFSHKILRWFTPFFMIAAFLTNLFLLDEPFYKLIFALQCLFYASAFVGQILNWTGKNFKPFNLCYYFLSMNLALLLGFFMFLFGKQRVTWERTER